MSFPSTPTAATPYTFQPQQGAFTTSNSATPYHTPTPPSNSPTSLTSSPRISPLFIDGLASNMDLPDDLRGNLHRFAAVCAKDGLLGQSDAETRLFLLAAVYQGVAESRQRAAENAVNDLASLMNDLKARLDDSFHLTKDQLDTCRVIAQDIICQPSKVNFKTLHIEVRKDIESRSKDLGFSNIFGRPAREKEFNRKLKRIASSVRSAFREELRDSLFDSKSKQPLEDFTVQMVTKYRKIGIGEAIGVPDVLRFALLRSFAIEHRALLRVEEPAEGSDDEDGSEVAEGSSGKRKRGGRVKKADDFWEQVDKYFTTGIAANGPELSNWLADIRKAIDHESRLYPGYRVRSLLPETDALFLLAVSEPTKVLQVFKATSGMPSWEVVPRPVPPVEVLVGVWADYMVS